MSLLDQMLEPDRMASAYSRLAKRPGLWLPEVPMRQVRVAPVSSMLRLADELRQGRYLAQPPATFTIGKADGSQRLLSVYGIRDRLVQRLLLDLLQPLSEPRFSDSSFGFRPGRSVSDAVSRAQHHIDEGYCWLVDADIQQCFDRIPRRALLSLVGRWLDDARVPPLVASCLGWRAADITSNARGVPQGACLSPWLCNLYLHELDQRSHRSRAPLVRFADDFILFAAARKRARQLEIRCGRWLESIGLSLHPHKTRLVHACRPVRFLGRSLQRRMAQR